MTLYCPACDKPYPNWGDLRNHLKKAEQESDEQHLEVLQGEEWDLSASTIDKADPDEV